jgi:uncharacterized radical SAM superfamily Fe-S cluster-containing enzyme
MTDLIINEPRPDDLVLSQAKQSGLATQMKQGLDAPICLTWELTYACNLQCVHCLSSSGRRDPDELTTAECEALIDELARMQVFYINVGGGEPTIRNDFWHLLRYAVDHGVGVKFSTNGSRIDAQGLRRRPDLDRRSRRRHQRSHPGRRLLCHRDHRHGAPCRSRFWRVQDLGGDDPSQH